MNTHPEPPVIHPPSTAGMERSKAWGCLAANLFVCPGVGSIMAGRRSGWLEVAGAVGGDGVDGRVDGAAGDALD